MNNKSTDLLNGRLSSGILKFSLPIALSSMFQQLFNSADTAVVGRFADKNALAAVGTNVELVAFLVCISAGLAIGANVLLASYIGSENRSRINGALHSSLLFALAAGIVLALGGQLISEPVLRLINTPEEIIDSAAVYLRIYCAGLPALMVFDFGAAALRSKGDSRRPFIILALSGVLNVLLNLFFVSICGMVVAGVAIATAIANAVSAICVLLLLGREEDEFRFSFGRLRLEASSVKAVVTVGIPAAMQGAVFCLANIFVQTAVNGFGTVAIDGSTIAMNYEYFTYYLITAFGQTATTFISQNYNAHRYDRCRRTLRLCILYAVVSSAAMTVPITVFSSFFAGIFSKEPDVIASGVQRIVIILTLEPICGLYEVPAGYLRGMGQSTKPAVVTVTGICLFRILWSQTVFRHFHTLPVLFAAFPISWVITTCLMWAVFRHSVKRSGDEAML